MQINSKLPFPHSLLYALLNERELCLRNKSLGHGAGSAYTIYSEIVYTEISCGAKHACARLISYKTQSLEAKLQYRR